MRDDLDRIVAESLTGKPELLPYLAELLADFWALGCDPELVVEAVRPLNFAPGESSVLDLGCGKGAVSISLARDLAIRARGIDAFEPFVSEARRRAGDEGVASLCEFEHGDMREAVEKERDFDLVVYGAIGAVLGAPAQCVAELRKCVRPGGFILIEDGFLAGALRVNFPGCHHYVSHVQTLKQLLSHGDSLVREMVYSDQETIDGNRRDMALITSRARQLSQKHPAKAALFSWYVDQQERECEILESQITPAMWLLQKR